MRLAKARAGKTMSMEEATNAVLVAAYRSESLEFRKIVVIALSRDSRFPRVAQGRCSAKWPRDVLSFWPARERVCAAGQSMTW